MYTFTIPVTREQFEAARAVIADVEKLHLVGDEGELNAHGVGLAFSFDGAANLTISVEHKPFYVSHQLIEDRIRNWFKQA